MNGSISWGNGVSKVYTLTETMGKKDHLSVRAISCILIAVLHCYTSLQAYKVFFSLKAEALPHHIRRGRKRVLTIVVIT